MANGKPIVTAYGTPREASLGWLDGRPPYVLFWPRMYQSLASVLRDEYGAVVHHGPDYPFFDYQDEFTDGLWTGNICDYAIIFHVSIGYFGPPEIRWYHEAPWQERIFDSWHGRYILMTEPGVPGAPEHWRIGNQYARDLAARIGITITEAVVSTHMGYFPVNVSRPLVQNMQRVGADHPVGVYGGNWLAAVHASGEDPFISTRYVNGVEWIVMGDTSMFAEWLADQWGVDNRPFMRNLWSVKREILAA